MYKRQQLSAASRPARINPAAAAYWPAAHTVFGGIEETFTAGFVYPADAPMILKRAMLTMLTAFYEDGDGGDMFAASEKAAMALCTEAPATGKVRIQAALPSAADLAVEPKPVPTLDILTDAAAEARYNSAVEDWGERG